MSSATRSSNSLAAGIAALARREGCNSTRHSGVVVYRVTVAEPPTPTLYPSSLILVGAGEKQAILGDKTFAYNAGHYLVVTSPLPMLCKTIASVDEPVLTMVVEIELALLRELLLELNAPPAPQAARSTRSVFRAPLPRDLEDAGARLLACLTDERRTRVLARQTLREMLFLVLEGPYGDPLRALAEGPVSQLAHVLRHMNTRFAERMSVGELAQLAHMSVPTFHQHFKTMTGSSPLQYTKALRLTRARQMLHAGSLVKAVAHDVGYESESQFSREYRRFFGWPPSADSHVAPRARP
ncbi:AraC family transcriptional regulator N-terminal domain-containing protein [Sorangium sp. So ce406]|uniref:AraC family transcriptional regulator n=1 Tax=Sorangium sp. So ce406 TaxID=3133311 RepID=UPI003F5AF5A0